MARKTAIASALTVPVVAIQAALRQIRMTSSSPEDARLASTISGASKRSTARNSSNPAKVVAGVLNVDTVLKVAESIVTAPSAE